MMTIQNHALNKKVLLVCVKHAFGSENDFSYEWNHFYLGLKNYFQSVDFFDFYATHQNLGQEAMQQKLRMHIETTKPDITLFSLITDQFSHDFVRSLKNVTKTFCFFMDDTWRTDFVAQWAPCFDAFSTSNHCGEKIYAAGGLANAIFMPFGVNENLFKDRGIKRDIDVSFIGAWHPHREWLIKQLQKKGISVQVFGDRWSSGVVDTEKMIEILNRSKISLNLSNSVSWDAKYLFSSIKSIRNTLRSKKIGEQIKGRHFEIPACRALQMSFYAAGLGMVFDIDKEIIIFNDSADLIQKIQFYLSHDDERECIADAGYRRIQKEHTYANKFVSAFNRLGWLSDAL